MSAMNAKALHLAAKGTFQANVASLADMSQKLAYTQGQHDDHVLRIVEHHKVDAVTFFDACIILESFKR
jgi:hypothetical protein